MANETFGVTQTTNPLIDTDLDGVIDPGEVVRTTATITNNSTNPVPIAATGVEFMEILAGMTIFDQAGALDNINVSPIAFHDGYNVIGNTTFTVGAADGVLGGLTAIHATLSADAEFFSHTIGANPATQTHIVTTGLIDTAGGSVTLNADGSFVYTPDAGFTGTDTFTYTLTDAGLDGNFATLGDNLTGTGTVTFTVEDLVWFIDNSGGGSGGTGTQADPFKTIANFNAVNDGAIQAHPGAGDYIYLREGGGTYSGTDGINLLNSQILIGQGENLVINHSLQGNMTIETGSAGDTPVIVVTGAGNQGIQLAQDNTISGLDIGMSNATAVGIKDNGNTVGTLTISNLGIGVGGNNTGQAIEVDNGGTINILLESVTSNGGANGIDIAGVSGNGAHFTVSGATTIGDVQGLGGGIVIASSTANANFTGAVTILNDAVGADGSGINITSSGTAFFAFDGGVSVIVNGSGVTALNLQTAGSVTIADIGTTQLISNNGPAIFVNPTTLNATIDQVTSGNAVAGSGGTDGIGLNGMSGSLTIGNVTINGQTDDGIEVSNSAGSLTINGGMIGNLNDPGGAGVEINGGTGAVSIGASITKSTAGNVVDVGSHTTGAVTFSGAISATGSVANGILLDGNSGTIAFTNGTKTLTTGASGGVTIINNSANIDFTGGGLVITTTSGAGLAAGTTGAGTAGTLTVTGAGNTISSGSGSAFVLNGTDSDGITFQSISKNGGTATGIFIKDAGAGGFTVTGTTSTANSGGTIQNIDDGGSNGSSTQGVGAYIENASNVSLSNMLFGNGTTIANFAIRGSNVSNFTLRDSVINGTLGDFAGTLEQLEGGIYFNNLTGVGLFEGNNISGGFADNMRIYNNAATGTLNLFVRDSANDAAIFGSNGITNSANDSLNVEVAGDGNILMLVDGVAFTAWRGDGVQASAVDTANLDVTVQNSSFNNAHPNIASGGGIGVLITGFAGGGSWGVDYTIQDNTFTGSHGYAMAASFFGFNGTARGFIDDNIVGTSGNGVYDGTGSTEAGGILARIERNGAGSGTLTHLVTISDNSIRDTAKTGIKVDSVQGLSLANNSVTEATVTGNTVSQMGGASSFSALYMLAGGADQPPPTGADDFGILRAEINNNTWNIDGTTNAYAPIYFDQIFGTQAKYEFPGYVGTNGQNTDIENYLTARTNVFVLDAGQLQPGAKVFSPDAIMNPGTLQTAQTGSNTQLPTGALMAAEPPPEAPAGGTGGTKGDGTGGGFILPAPEPVTGVPVEPAMDPVPGPTPAPVIVDDGYLSHAELAFFIDAAIARWVAAGLTPEQVAALHDLTFHLADLPGLYLGSYNEGVITIDLDGTGRGWYADATPLEDSEFADLVSSTRLLAAAGSDPAGRYDLLTTVMHEMGHALGLSDLYDLASRDELLYGYLFAGERRLPGAGDADGATPGAVTSEAYAGSPIVVNGGNSTTGAFTLPAGYTVTIQWDATIDDQMNQLIVNPQNTGTVSATNPPTAFPDQNSNTVTTILDSLTLGGTVWLDNGAGGGTAGDGLKQAGETIQGGVLVSLFVDANNDDVADTPGTALLTATTSAGGDYLFTGLAPGNYIVRIDADNFTTGGASTALVGRITSTGNPDPDLGDPDTDDDDNGYQSAGPQSDVFSNAITLAYNSEPAAGTGDDTNTTLDFGFVTPNQPPQQTDLQGDTVTWTEGDGAVLLDDSSAPELAATITDPDSADFGGGSLIVTISVGAFPAEEGLFIQSIGNITSNPLTASTGTVSFMTTEFATYAGGGFGGGNITFTFDGDATPAAVQALVRAMSYNNNGGDNPTAGLRLVSWTLNDGDGDANGGNPLLLMSSSINVAATNDNPVIANLGGDSATYVEQAPAVLLDDSSAPEVAATVTDPDHANFNGGSVTVSITANEVAAEDVLGISTAGTVTLSSGTSVGSIVSVGGSAIGTISANGAGGNDLVIALDTVNATPGRVTTLVQALTYANTNTVSPATAARTVAVTVADGGGGSDSESVTVNVTDAPENALPVVDLDATDPLSNDDTNFFPENFASPSGLGNDIEVTDTEGDDITGATITITDPEAGDLLSANLPLPGGITINTGASTNTLLVLTGTTTAANYAAALGQLGYSSSSEDPTDGDTNNDRLITVTVSDAFGTSVPRTMVMGVGAINDPPTLTANGLNPTFPENAPAADLFGTVAASTIEANQTLVSLTLTVTNVTDGAAEILGIDGSNVALTNGNSVATTHGTVNVTVAMGGTATVTLTGATLLVSELVALVDALSYRNTSDNPTDANRVVTITQLVDSGLDIGAHDNTTALSLVSTVNVNPSNDPAGISGDASGTVQEAGGLNNGTAGDQQDSGDLDSTDVDNPADSWTAVLTATGTIGGYGTYTLTPAGVWTYTLNDNHPSVQALNGPATLNDTFNAVTVDGTAQLVTIVISAQDDAAVANDDAFTTDEATAITTLNVFDDTGSGPDADPDSGGAPTVTGVTGGTVGVEFALPSGALLRLNSDGTFTYNPNNQFNFTPAPGSGAANLSTPDSFTYTLSGGDTATANISITGLDTNDTLIGTAGADTLQAGVGTDTITGLAGNDYIDGGTGVDTMTGGADNDTYVVDNSADRVIEADGEGNDFVYARVNYTLNGGSRIETLSVTDHTASTALNFTGNEFGNNLLGNNGVNLLNGAGGADVMIGFGGDDIYAVDNAGDRVFENSGGGSDRIATTVSYVLQAGSHVEILSAADHSLATALALTGNELGNVVLGNEGANVLDGGGGADVMVGFGGNDKYAVDNAGDQVFETAGGGTDTVYATVSYSLAAAADVETLTARDHGTTNAMDLTGNGLANNVYGNNGVNTLDGGGGADVMIGFGGNDVYVVDNAGDIAFESGGQGSDTVYTTTSYTLNGGSEIEILTVSDHGLTTAIDLTGNTFANTLLGNNGVNTLNGGGGSDTLAGFGGADIFAFTTTLGAGNVDLITDFLSGTDKIALENAVFTGLPAGALAPGAFHTGAAAHDPDDRIIYDTTTGALYFDADGDGGGAQVQFATLFGLPSLVAGDFTVI